MLLAAWRMLVLCTCSMLLSCRTPPSQTMIAPVEQSVRVEFLQDAANQELIRFTLRAWIHNSGASPLSIETSCGAGLRLEFEDGKEWRPVVAAQAPMACVSSRSVEQVFPGDSTVLPLSLAAQRAPGSQWVAPLTARFRVLATASRCVRRELPACWIILVSPPFTVHGASDRSGRSTFNRRPAAQQRVQQSAELW